MKVNDSIEKKGRLSRNIVGVKAGLILCSIFAQQIGVFFYMLILTRLNQYILPAILKCVLSRSNSSDQLLACPSDQYQNHRLAIFRA